MMIDDREVGEFKLKNFWYYIKKSKDIKRYLRIKKNENIGLIRNKIIF